MAEKEMKIDKVTGEVIEEKKVDKKDNVNTAKSAFNPFTVVDDSDDSEYSVEGDRTIYCPKDLFLFREKSKSGKKNSEGGDYYNYATGFSLEFGASEIPFVLFFRPQLDIDPVHCILDRFFGESDQIQLEVVHRSITQDGNKKPIDRYSFRVSGEDVNGVPVSVNLKATGKNTSDMIENLISKLKADGRLS